MSIENNIDNEESIYFINEYLNRVEPEDLEPFIKMKRQAHQGLQRASAEDKK